MLASLRDRLALAATALFAAATAPAACSGDTVVTPSGDPSSATSTTAAAGGGAGAGGAGGATSSSSGTGGAGGGVGGSGGSGGACDPTLIDPNDPCEACVGEQCFELAIACCNIEGCLAIVDCARETGCTGTDCYLPSTCKNVIDRNGGLSVAVNSAQPLAECAFENCEACLPGGAGGSGGDSAQ